MKNYFLTLAIFFGISTIAQNKYPKDYFRSPLNIPIKLSGTFGELRNNHFHAGLDIKTNRKVGLPVYATADGYVSRIKVAIWGYGKVLYVKHNNGFTSVYAHLSRFEKSIQNYVKNIQYEKESYETGNIYPGEDEIFVKKGDIIAYSGRTGGFVAPHLHYEIRDTKTEHIINPLFFGLKVQDSIAPKIKRIMVYPIEMSSRVNRSAKKQTLGIKRDSLNTYRTNRISASGKIGFGLNVYDLLGEELNKNGVFSIEMLVNGKRHYFHNLETFSFAESKFINLLIDYPYYKTYKNRIQKTFKENANKLSIYKDLIYDGVIDIKEGLNYRVEIIAKDYKGNSSSIKIPIIGVRSESMVSQQQDTTNYKIIKKQVSQILQERSNHSVS